MKKFFAAFLGLLLICTIAPSALAKNYLQVDLTGYMDQSNLQYLREYTNYAILGGVSGNYDISNKFSVSGGFGLGKARYKNNLILLDEGIDEKLNYYSGLTYYADIFLKFNVVNIGIATLGFEAGMGYEGSNCKLEWKKEIFQKTNTFNFFIGVYGELYLIKDLMVYGNMLLPIGSIGENTYPGPQEGQVASDKYSRISIGNPVMHFGVKYNVASNVFVGLDYTYKDTAVNMLMNASSHSNSSRNLKLSVGYMF